MLCRFDEPLDAKDSVTLLAYEQVEEILDRCTRQRSVVHKRYALEFITVMMLVISMSMVMRMGACRQ